MVKMNGGQLAGKSWSEKTLAFRIPVNGLPKKCSLFPLKNKVKLNA
ncbi:hypothetical protein HNQ44_002589 [Planomicrobium koreense]|uniref:Uncharacterized protein n=1 Tax=Planococcus koreensis TaxID=112331 RepID=A0A7W8CUJ2_9BACL|nr:hypothetical protein [Planococcus koreensis]MBB5181124.1 hypothetical protein [Planococcus koreensis]